MKKRIMLLIPVLLLIAGIFVFQKPAAKAAQKTGVSITSVQKDLAVVEVAEKDKGDKDEDEDKTAGYYIKKFLIAAVIGLIVAFIAVGIMKSGMKNIRKSSNAKDYVLKDSFRLLASEDRFLKEEEKRTRKASN
ncbi:MAG: hypothetical protein J5643_07580 [Lachnospiraceae bacterium]|nr:hypothetical protein [Lachnospiraceae bacterium]